MKNLTLLIAIVFVALFSSCKKGDEPTPSETPIKYYRVISPNQNVDGYVFKDAYMYTTNVKFLSTKYEITSSDKNDILNGIYSDSITVINPYYNPSNLNSNPTWTYYKVK